MTRISGFVALNCLAAIALTMPAVAQRNAPYCATFSAGAGIDCSYPSLQSCLASVSGVGGTCNVNPRAPDQPPPPRLPNPFSRLFQGNGPAFAPIDVGPPPDSGLTSARRQPRREWPYCAWYSNGSTNCGFPTLQSCRAAVSGVGGVCRANPRVAPAGGRGS